MLSTVSDWSPPSLISGEVSFAPWLMIGLVASALITILYVRRRLPIALIIISLLLLSISVVAERFIPFAAIALAFLLAALIGSRESCRNAFDSRTSRAVIVALCIVGSILIMLNGPFLGANLGPDKRISLGRQAGVGFDEEKFPVEAVDFMRGKIFGGKPFNDMAWGGYLIWRLWPRGKVFIDTRTAVYGDEFIRRYSDALFDEEAFDALHAEYGFNYVIYDAREMAVPGGLLRFLAGNPNWLELVRTPNAVVYLSVKRN